MRPFLGPFVDGPDRPAPELIELANVVHPTFGFLLDEDAIVMPGPVSEKMLFLKGKARDAYQWLLDQAVGPVYIVPNLTTGRSSYVHVQMKEVQDAVLFKTFWL